MTMYYDFLKGNVTWKKKKTFKWKS